ncbi:stage IV sporulation protein A [Hespellia stercorisuis]|uniref:Stage IV sporulation protein A n=1 Tax=Hespellia stercorisuis DSM 15480 TaxID=1121950 RepID=A0A1M6HU46_9FIRM|nr:stage IV sporulation protein A [Hespellia stercorisuis]SHJ25680.1 stage IV sporulation protein A [Hespellia stercorisuis DSM 15480]
MEQFDLYNDIQVRTNGEIYIGVVGPVRAGKSTFIKRFVDLLVLPGMADEHSRKRTRDELPQSASGTTIMTTEPKFVPKEAAKVKLSEDVEVKVRLIDCVGYMVDGATGYMEGGEERKVKTPWFDYAVPFTKAAGIGTQKVIRDHSTIGIVITTDGSFGELERERFVAPEQQTIQELQSIGKPFIVLLNTQKPYSEEARKLVQKMETDYRCMVLPVNCEQLRLEDIHAVMKMILYGFPVTEVAFYIPKWVEMLSRDHKIKQDLLQYVRKVMAGFSDVKSAFAEPPQPEGAYIDKMLIDKVEMDTGRVKIRIDYDQKYYYETLSELTGMQIAGEYEMIAALKELAAMQTEYLQIRDAFADVKMKGYGVVTPKREEILLEDPVLIKQGNKYGVKIHSEAPSIHMIRANISTEIAPIVGNEKQAQDLVEYIKESGKKPEGVWKTNIFGKSVEELVLDGMHNKIMMINEESQVKLQDTMQKIVNDSNGGMVCIII